MITPDDGGKKRRKPGRDAAQFKTNDSGKIVIEEGDEEDGDVAMEDVAGTAYKESLTSADGFTRGPNGRVKFNKDTKKRRREEETEDIEMADLEAAGGKKPEKKRAQPKLGQEFKAKVRLSQLEVMNVYLSLYFIFAESWGRCQERWR